MSLRAELLVRDVVALVVVLGLGIGPLDVARLVIPIIIDAIKRILWAWFWSNEVVERLEGLDPFWVHRNPATAVARICGIVGIEASLLNASPGVPFGPILDIQN